MKFPRSARLTLPLLLSVPFIAAGSARAQDALLSTTAAWDYLSPLDGVNPATMDDDFDSTWTTGENYDGPAFITGKPGPFSYGGISYFTAGNITGTFIGTGADGNTAPDAGLRYTSYFRTTFTALDLYSEVRATMLADDGAVIYIDGEEVGRLNMSGSANGTGDFYEMLADDATNTEVAPLRTVNLGLVSAGPHTLALSLHNADVSSSDLGFSMELSGLKPVLLRRDIGGVFTDIREAGGISGWTPRSPGCWQLHAPDAGSHDLQSASVDLSGVGEVWFSMELFCHETSTGSDFEDTDVFGARLLAIMDDNSRSEIPLLPASLDLNGDGVLSGAEFAPGTSSPATAVVLGRQLSAAVPANVKSVSLLVSGQNDSSSEYFAFGGALISDRPPGSDADGDGISREVELQAGTDPNNAASAFVITDSYLELNPASSNYEFFVIFPAFVGRQYGFETAAVQESGLVWNYLGAITATATGSFTVYVNLGPLPDPRFLARVRCMP